MDKQGKLIKQEIFSVGIWNGMKFELNDLKDIAKSFAALQEVIRVPLKLGHDDNQPLTDGLPAIGWVESVTLNEAKDPPKLEAEFRIISPEVIRAIELEMYQSVSIELDLGVTYKDSDFNFVLTGVALLGAQLPAVNNLNDIGKYFKRKESELTFSKAETLHFNFNNEDKTMSDEKLNNLQEQITKLTDGIALSKEETEKVNSENEKLKAKVAKFEKDAADSAYKAQRADIESQLETLVKQNKILPSVRETFTKDISVENIDSKATAAKMMFDSLISAKDKAVDSEENGQHQDFSRDTSEAADAQLHRVAKQAQLEKKLSYTEAVEFALVSNPELATAWAEQDGYIRGEQ
jgi:hypothetical protein